MTATYTHTGRRASIGYVHCSKDGFTHTAPRSGRRHALNAAGPAGYVAVCGVTVPIDTSDHRCAERNPVELATVNPKVTCKACLRRKPVAGAVPKRTRFVVFLAVATGEVVRWSTEATRALADRYAAGIADRGAASTTHPAGYVLNAWAETRTE